MRALPALFVEFSIRRAIRKSTEILTVLILLTAAYLLAAPAAWAFGCEAHETIALIAEMHLTPHARAMAQQILRDNPIDPALNRYCKQPDLNVFAYSATWADDYRTVHPETSRWHEIDIPIAISGGKTSDYCSPSEGCVTRALEEQIAILRSPSTDPEKRANALRFVIHFVGDLHQPLHVTDNSDQGGNCLPVTFFGDAPKLIYPEHDYYELNLHRLWDYAILQRALPHKTVAETAEELHHKFAKQETKWAKDDVNVEAWTWETFHLGRKVAYGKLPVPVKTEKPVPVRYCSGNDHVGLRMLKLNEQIGQPYEDIATPVIEEQVAKAGARLALILNRVWP
jgi:hypothetical protein